MSPLLLGMIGAWLVGTASQGPTTTSSDWTRFGWDAGRSSAPTGPTRITAANVASLVRQQVAIDGTVDAAAIYLHGVPVNGAKHDALFVTTMYGKTLAIDADDGTVLWRYTPPKPRGWRARHLAVAVDGVSRPPRPQLRLGPSREPQ